MYAIVDIAGQQVKVEKGQKILVHRLNGEIGSKVEFDKVMLITNDGKTSVGDPVIDGAEVQATIVDHIKGDKVFVFKKKRRKGYKKLNGHRQYLSLLEIEEINEKAAKKAKAPAKKKTKKEESEVVEAATEEPVAETPVKEEKAKPEAKAEAKPEPKAKAKEKEEDEKEEKTEE